MRKSKRGLLAWLLLMAALLAGSLLTGHGGKEESIQTAMRDAVLHDVNRVNFFGKAVNPGLISAFTVTAILLVAAALLRIFVIPKFRYVPGKLQLVLEEIVGLFDRLAKTSSPHLNGFLGAYIFAAGAYIFVGTLFELFGFQAVTTAGHSITLPAPLSDVNAAIALGCLSYLVIVSGGVAGNGIRGVGLALKEFSLPISMSFRLFGALLSGLLVTELVYYYINLSFVLSQVMTGGGPNGASSVLLQYMYTQGFVNGNFGYAMAITVFTLAISVALSMLSRKLTDASEGGQ